MFGMGTGVAPPVRSPEKLRTGVRCRVLGVREEPLKPVTWNLKPAFLIVRCLYCSGQPSAFSFQSSPTCSTN